MLPQNYCWFYSNNFKANEILTLVFNLYVIEKAVVFVWLTSLTYLILNKGIITNVNKMLCKSAWIETKRHMTRSSISCSHCLSKLQFENITFALPVYILLFRFDLKFLLISCFGKYITLQFVSWTWPLSSWNESVNGEHTTCEVTCV